MGCLVPRIACQEELWQLWVNDAWIPCAIWRPQNRHLETTKALQENVQSTRHLESRTPAGNLIKRLPPLPSTFCLSLQNGPSSHHRSTRSRASIRCKSSTA